MRIKTWGTVKFKLTFPFSVFIPNKAIKPFDYINTFHDFHKIGHTNLLPTHKSACLPCKANECFYIPQAPTCSCYNIKGRKKVMEYLPACRKPVKVFHIVARKIKIYHNSLG